MKQNDFFFKILEAIRIVTSIEYRAFSDHFSFSLFVYFSCLIKGKKVVSIVAAFCTELGLGIWIWSVCNYLIVWAQLCQNTELWAHASYQNGYSIFFLTGYFCSLHSKCAALMLFSVLQYISMMRAVNALEKSAALRLFKLKPCSFTLPSSYLECKVRIMLLHRWWLRQCSSKGKVEGSSKPCLENADLQKVLWEFGTVLP